MLNNPKTGTHVFVIVNEGCTSVHEAIITGEIRDGHYCCDLTDEGPHIGMTKYRRECQIFPTRVEAQKELDDLTSYINYRMAGHKMK